MARRSVTATDPLAVRSAARRCSASARAAAATGGVRGDRCAVDEEPRAERVGPDRTTAVLQGDDIHPAGLLAGDDRPAPPALAVLDDQARFGGDIAGAARPGARGGGDDVTGIPVRRSARAVHPAAYGDQDAALRRHGGVAISA